MTKKKKLPRPYGWHCVLIHKKSGAVINSTFWTDAPLEGDPKNKGYTWKATTLYTAEQLQSLLTLERKP